MSQDGVTGPTAAGQLIFSIGPRSERNAAPPDAVQPVAKAEPSSSRPESGGSPPQGGQARPTIDLTA